SAGSTSLSDLSHAGDSSRGCGDPAASSQAAGSRVLGSPISSVTDLLLGGPGCSSGTPNTSVAPAGQTVVPSDILELDCNDTITSGPGTSTPFGSSDGIDALLMGWLRVAIPSTD